jgi:hypothetical protein
MPVRGLGDVLRIPRTFTIRLGQRVKKLEGGGKSARLKLTEQGGYPEEVEYFVLAPEEVPEDILKLYDKQPKALRMMLLTEYDFADEYGHELTLSLNNRAWRARNIRCFGHGRAADEADIAYTNDEQWALRISQRGGTLPQLLEGEARKAAPIPGDKVWRIPCLGQDCPKYDRKVEGVKDGQKAMVQAEGHDADASCKVNIILRAFLLHPNFGKKGAQGERDVLAGVQVASGSYNSIVQLRSGFRLMKEFTKGRTVGIPFTLIRKPTTTFTPMRQIHWTLDILPQPAQWQEFATLSMHEIFLTDEVREYRRQLAAQPLGVDFDVVRDLYPARERRALTAPEAQVPREAAVDTSASVAGADTTAGDPASPEPTPEQLDTLTISQRNELRRLFGTRVDPEGPEDDHTNPWNPEVNEKLKAAVELYNEQVKPEQPILSFKQITEHAAEFIRKLAEGQPHKE